MTTISSEHARVPVPNHLVIRHEVASDSDWIENLHAVSFGPGRFTRSAFRVREQFDIDPELCFVAEIEGQSAASVRMTPINVGGQNGYLLGPLMTDPSFRKLGAGRALVLNACEQALSKPNVDFVLLVGDRAYYCPLGFVPTVPYAIKFPGPVDPTRVLVFSEVENIENTLAGSVSKFITE